MGIETGSNIIQAGADSIATSSPQYKFWTEDYPEGTVWEGPAISAGQRAYINFDYLGNGTTTYLLENETTGVYETFKNSSPYVGHTLAEYINERLNGLYLPNFGSAHVTKNYFWTFTTSYGLTANNNKYIMTSNCGSSGKVLSEPNGVTSINHTFTQYWYASTPVCN